MNKIRWRKNQVISIETKKKDENRDKNVYVLAQMLKDSQMLFFNLFREDNNWVNVDLSDSPILFCTYVTRQFLKYSNVFKQDIAPLVDYTPTNLYINSLGVEWRSVKLWEGTPDEYNVLVLGSGGQLVEEEIAADGILIPEKIIIPRILETDNQTIDKYEMSNVRIYPELNERLHLCYRFNKNVDPLKDLKFNRFIPIEYKEYMEIMMS